MRKRYKIYETYNGLFDTKNVLCLTDSLFHAVHIVEQLNKATEDNPCYDYDFVKLVASVDETLDYYPGESFLDEGFVLNCSNYEDFLAKYKGGNK